MVNSIVLILAVVLFVILAGLFAGAETGIYQLSRLRLRLGIEKKRLSSVILGKSLRDSTALLLSMLIGDNLAHYLATSIVTFLLLSKVEVEHAAELLATIIIAPTLFVFSELIPKNIFFYRSDTLMPLFAPVLFVFHKLFTFSGIVPLLKGISSVIAKLAGLPTPVKMATTAVRSSHIRTILRDTQEEDILSPVQTDMINRLAGIFHLSISSVMTPINKVQMADAKSDKTELLQKLKRCPFTRLPVVDDGAANIIGFINIFDCLSSAQEFTDLHNFMKPIRKLPGYTIVTEAIDIMRSENQKIVLVTRVGHAGREKPIGIVTMKDLVEELLGELRQW